jgi:manganese transport protein
MAGGSIFAGIFSEPYDTKDKHTKTGISISLIIAVLIIFLLTDLFKGLIISQMILSIQLPFTIFLQIYLTSSKKVMGAYSNKLYTKIILLIIGAIVTYLNIRLFYNLLS